MNLNELRQGILRAKSEILSALQSEAATAGADAAALVETRIVTKGENREGTRLSPYSAKKVAAFRYFGRSRNAGGEVAIKKAAKENLGVSYRDFRQLNGLNTGIKNLQFTGEMWQGFGVRSVRVIGNGIVEIEIGGKNARSNLLLSAHSEREKTEITSPSDKEIAIVTAGIQQRVKQIIERNV